MYIPDAFKWLVIATCLVITVSTISSCNSETKQLQAQSIQRMLEKGFTPQEIQCALGESKWDTNSICLAIAMNRQSEVTGAQSAETKVP